MKACPAAEKHVPAANYDMRVNCELWLLILGSGIGGPNVRWEVEEGTKDRSKGLPVMHKNIF